MEVTRKVLVWYVIASLYVVLVLFNKVAFAAESADSGNVVNVKIDEKLMEFEDQVPVIVNGRTLVPMRAIFEGLGAKIEWDGGNQQVTATKDDIKIILKIGNEIAEKNGQNLQLDVPPLIMNDRTMVPLRFVGEAMGAKVDWDDVTQMVNITTTEGSASASTSSSDVIESGKVLFSDDFEKGDAKEWSEIKGKWTVETQGDTKVYSQKEQGVNLNTVAGSTDWTDYTIEAKVKVEPNSQRFVTALLGRFINSDNRYGFALVDNKACITKYVDGKYYVVDEKEYPLIKGNDYTLKAVMNGSKLELYVNGKLEVAATDTDFKSGKIGLFSSLSIAHFDDVKVTEVKKRD